MSKRETELANYVSDIRSDVAAVKADLREHMRRTELLEVSVAEFRVWMGRWAGAWTALGVLATLVGIGASIVKILGH